MKKYEVKEIGPIIEKAWNATLELACKHPEVIYFRETQLHIEFAHLILTYLKDVGYTLWEDLVIAFDTPHFGFEGSGGIPWGLVGNNSIRPDIYIKPARRKDCKLPKIWIEIKSQSNILRKNNGDLVAKIMGT